MPDSNNILERRAAIYDDISKGHVAKGIKLLLDFVPDFSNEAEEEIRATAISADFNTIKKMFNDGELSIDEFLRHRRRIITKALELLTEIIENQPRMAA